MATWIETEGGKVLINTEHVRNFVILPMSGAGAADDSYGVVSAYAPYEEDSDHYLLTDLTLLQAQQVIKHLGAWVPAQTGRTIRMAELGASVRTQEGR